jgi:hypothetical protein
VCTMLNTHFMDEVSKNLGDASRIRSNYTKVGDCG